MAWGASQGNGAHVTAVDAWDLPNNSYDPPFIDPSTRETAYSNVRNLGYEERITLVRGFAHATGGAWGQWNGTKVGLLFVDDDHSAEGVHAAFEAWVPHLAEGAVIAFDDYGHPDWPGVKQAVDELVDNGQVEPVEIYHDRLAVTKLRTEPLVSTTVAPEITAITSEGVEPAPPTEVQDDLTDKTSAELRDIAAEPELAIRLKPGSNKSVIIAAIRKARAAQADQ